MARLSHAAAGLVLAGALLALPATPSTLAAPAAAKPVAAHHDAPAKEGDKRVRIVIGGTDEVAFIASVVGVTPAVLQQDLAAGQTLLQIAGGRYASADALADALLAPLKGKLDAAVAAGKMTAADETSVYAKAHDMFARLVVTPHPELMKGQGAAARDGAKMAIKLGPQDLAATLAAACNTSASALQAALQAGGKSILAACQATNPSATADSLVAALSAPMKASLDAAVAAGKLTAAQETQMLVNVRTKLTAMVTGAMPLAGGTKRA